MYKITIRSLKDEKDTNQFKVKSYTEVIVFFETFKNVVDKSIVQVKKFDKWDSKVKKKEIKL